MNDPYREPGQVVTKIEKHYHFEKVAAAMMFIAAGVVIGRVAHAVVMWRVEVAKIEAAAPPAPCQDTVFQANDYVTVSCDSRATMSFESGYMFCRCPRSTTTP